ncbi:hypothetical protein NHX12_009637 [Muraenolepis orangiensis]|uniref:Sodium/potassium-transporting ATPase subunit beta-2 n=1 Tax=Muraenolepis orangiensis TaxID=630683 RepID=A0A9Q0DJQ9_9TELE|nr:hypothetical protein NHX12_009637 [Muraenolepis orangiensis]
MEGVYVEPEDAGVAGQDREQLGNSIKSVPRIQNITQHPCPWSFPLDQGHSDKSTSMLCVIGGLILLFYLVFYIFLAGMFALTMYVMLQTLDDHKPTWQDRLATPGMMIRPNTENKQEDTGTVKNNPKRSCQFNRTLLDECSGISDPYYGYQDAKPCIIIKLNRVIGLLPGKNGVAPYVTCGAKKEDTEKIGELMYFPPNGTFNLMYYPYYGKKAQPLGANVGHGRFSSGLAVTSRRCCRDPPVSW